MLTLIMGFPKAKTHNTLNNKILNIDFPYNKIF